MSDKDSLPQIRAIESSTPSNPHIRQRRHSVVRKRQYRIPKGQPGNAHSDFHRALSTKRNIGNPSPLGLSAFALTTFLLSMINLNVLGVVTPSIVISVAAAYGGLVQLLAGMWEMAIGNTFGATALSSYGGFWLSIAIILTPGGFEIIESYSDTKEFQHAFALFLFGWFIFTTILLACTLSSSIAFASIFLTLDLAFLCLALARTYPTHLDAAYMPHQALTYAGGVFGLLSAFSAWYNALAGILENSNGPFTIPVGHFSGLVSKSRRTYRRGKLGKGDV